MMDTELNAEIYLGQAIIEQLKESQKDGCISFI